MQKSLVIKGKCFGEGKPLICLPVTKTSAEEIVAEVKRLVALGADVIEWRVDAFAEASDLNAIRAVLKEIGLHTKDTPLIYTFRSKAQGGMLELPAEMIYDIHQVGVESKVVDLVDVEFFAANKASREIASLQKMGVSVIASHHDFSETPRSDVMELILRQMRDSGTDIVKLAVMPQTEADVLALMEVTANFHKSYPKTPVITMSMGSLGMLSRISGSLTGSCLTFGNAGEASAPGQIEYQKLAELLDLFA